MTITVPPDYNPKKDKDFMNPVMLEYFRRKLLTWRAELLEESNETLQSLQEGGIVEPDIADRASIETERALELRTRDRAGACEQGHGIVPRKRHGHAVPGARD